MQSAFAHLDEYLKKRDEGETTVAVRHDVSNVEQLHMMERAVADHINKPMT